MTTLARAALGAALAAGVLHATPAALGLPPITRRLPAGATGGTGRPPASVALTFDDGPHPRGTPAILDILAEFDVTATFFIIGEQLARQPDVGRRIVALGHEVAVHGWTHRCTLAVAPRTLAREIQATVQLIADLTGERPTRYRPPYGLASAGALLACRAERLTPTWWTAWGRDWDRTASPRSVQTLLSARLRPPGVHTVLLHDSDTYGRPGSWRITSQATRTLLSKWNSTGVTVTALPAMRRETSDATQGI